MATLAPLHYLPAPSEASNSSATVERHPPSAAGEEVEEPSTEEQEAEEVHRKSAQDMLEADSRQSSPLCHLLLAGVTTDQHIVW